MQSLGKIDPRTITKVVKEMTPEEEARLKRVAQRPPLSECLNLHDFETIARAVMPEKAWAYYSSAADDEITHRENHAAYQRIWFRPRVLRDVTRVDWSTSILGQKSSMPVYIVSYIPLVVSNQLVMRIVSPQLRWVNSGTPKEN
jgi:L-lactate dehydrogenase (cytochrome)